MHLLMTAIVLLLAAPQTPAGYRAEIEKHRADRIAELTAPDGWLAVRGLFWLHDGANTAGSDPASAIKLPPRTAKRVGVFTLANGQMTFTADANARVTSDGKPVTTITLGRGGTASARDIVRVKCAAKVEAQTLCTASGFPRNLSRLNNVDKACLDDVASRLRADPRAKVVVIGYADSNESHPDVVSRTRAEAIKTYLVKERGIDETRITTRGAGATKLVETGPSASARARNRRAEVILVPEGASVP